ncbi:TonB-dependent receptor plug domain-containing protein [Runella zeae]|uniref:TonB-dependent receptor plug domain-containing protein n=1 Tax=Runella zeae TaxID=94255 RepID=UPI00048C7E4A|nr:TonB-dependent receptor [Runella zeae]
MGKNLRFYAIIIGVMALSLQVGRIYGQSCEESVDIPDAEKKFTTGNFDEVFSILLPCLKTGYSPNAKVQAHKILAMTYLALDSTQQASRSIQNLLAINPSFVPDFASSPQFKELFQYVKDSQERIIQITSVSKRAENVLKVPATVTVITDKDIIKRGYQNLEQVLHDLSGFDIAKGNGPGYSNFYGRGYRSTSNDRMLMLIDGIEENDLASDNIPISRQYPLSDIERIEVVYGPAATMYGNNAFVGVINIITKKYAEIIDANNKVQVKGQTRYGTWNSRYLDATVATKTKDVAISVSGRFFESNEMNLSQYPEWNYGTREASDYASHLNRTGTAAQTYANSTQLLTKYPNSDLYTVEYANNAISAIKLTPKGQQRAAELDNQLFNGNAFNQPVSFNDFSRDWYIKGKMEFKEFTILTSSWRTDEGAAPWYTNQTRLSTRNLSRWITLYRSLAGIYNKVLSEKFQIVILSSYRLHEIDGGTNLASYRSYYNNRLGIADLAAGTTPTYSTVYYYRGSNQFRNELRALWSPLPTLDINSGVEYRNSIIQGNYITSATPNPDDIGFPADTLRGGNNFRALDLGIYTQATYRYSPSLNLVAGLRLDNNRVRKSGGYGVVVNPRLSVIYSKGNFIFKGIYAEAFKDASYLQKYGTTSDRRLNNPTLQPEKVRNMEFSVYYKISKEANINIAAYRANYSNAVGLVTVVLENGTRTNQFQGIGRQRIWGIQAEANYQTEKLNIWSNFTYTNPTDLTSGLRISDIADFSFNIGANYQLNKSWHFNLTSHYVSARKSGAGTSGSRNPIQSFDPYLVLDGVVTYHNLFKGVSVQATVNNLLDKEYFVPGIREADNIVGASRFPQEHRNFSIGILFDIK